MKSILKISTLVVGVAYSACTSVGNMGQANRLNFGRIKQKAYEFKDKVIEHAPEYIKDTILPLGVLAAPYAINYVLEQAIPLCRQERDGKYQFAGYTGEGAITKAHYADWGSYSAYRYGYMELPLNYVEDLYFNHQTVVSLVPLLAYMGCNALYRGYQNLSDELKEIIKRNLKESAICTAVSFSIGVPIGIAIRTQLLGDELRSFLDVAENMLAGRVAVAWFFSLSLFKTIYDYRNSQSEEGQQERRERAEREQMLRQLEIQQGLEVQQVLAMQPSVEREQRLLRLANDHRLQREWRLRQLNSRKAYERNVSTQRFSSSTYGHSQCILCQYNIEEGAEVKVFHPHSTHPHVFCSKESDQWAEACIEQAKMVMCPLCKVQVK